MSDQASDSSLQSCIPSLYFLSMYRGKILKESSEALRCQVSNANLKCTSTRQHWQILSVNPHIPITMITQLTRFPVLFWHNWNQHCISMDSTVTTEQKHCYITARYEHLHLFQNTRAHSQGKKKKKKSQFSCAVHSFLCTSKHCTIIHEPIQLHLPVKMYTTH